MRVADGEVGVDDLSVGHRHAEVLLGAECPLVDLDRLRTVFEREVRNQGVLPFGNRLHGHDASFVVWTSVAAVADGCGGAAARSATDSISRNMERQPAWGVEEPKGPCCRRSIGPSQLWRICGSHRQKQAQGVAGGAHRLIAEAER